MSKLIVVVDMQNDFVNPKGALCVPGAEKLVEPIKEFCIQNTSGILNENNKLVFTQDTHLYATIKTVEEKTLPKHCEWNTWGWELIPELYNKDSGFWAFSDRLPKHSFAAEKNELELVLDNEEYDEIEICGVCTDICVLSMALQLRSLYTNAKIRVHASLCAGTSAGAHFMALKLMEGSLIEIVR